MNVQHMELLDTLLFKFDLRIGLSKKSRFNRHHCFFLFVYLFVLFTVGFSFFVIHLVLVLFPFEVSCVD